LRSPKKAGAVLTAGYFPLPGKNVENAMDSSSLPAKQRRDNAARNIPGRKNRKIIPGRKKDGAVKTVEYFLLRLKNAANVGDISSLPAKKQKNTAAKNVHNPGRKKDGAAKTVGFFLPLKKNAANVGDISSLPAKKLKNTAAKNVHNPDPKKDGAARMVGFSLPPKKNAVSKEDSSSILARKQKNTVKKNVPTRKIIHVRKNPKKDGAVKMVRFFLLIC
jgi:hypothetical protein